MFPARAVVLLCLLLAVNSGAADRFSDAGLVAVTSLDQLWRYQVGPSGTEYGITPGDDYICLRDWKGKFIRGTSQGPYNDRTDCFTHERFVVEILGNNRVSLKRYEGNYLRCSDPSAGASSSLVDAAKFILYIDEDDEDRLYLYSPTYDRVFGAYDDNHLLTCSSTATAASETFYGWKTGSRDSWTATDSWVVVGTFDNRNSQSTGRFTYSKTVGTEQSRTSSTGAGIAVTSEVEVSFGEFFSYGVSSTTSIDWSQESSATWSESTTIEASITVPPGVATTLYQAVGTYGIYTAKSNYFRADDFDANGNLLHQRPLVPVT